MKMPKDGYYTVYLLPAEWYVGMTGYVSNRMSVHKCKDNRDISNWTVLAEVYDLDDALNIEAHYHNRGYNGKRITPESIIKRVNNTNWELLNTKRIANTDFKAASIKKQKIIIQLDLNGNFIKEWESVNSAALGIGVAGSSLSNCLKGKCKSVKGFKWEYKI